MQPIEDGTRKDDKDKNENKKKWFQILVVVSLVPVICLCGLCLYQVVKAVKIRQQAADATKETYNFKYLDDIVRYLQLEQAFSNAYIRSSGQQSWNEVMNMRAGVDQAIDGLHVLEVNIHFEKINTKEKLKAHLKEHREKVWQLKVSVNQNIAFYGEILEALVKAAEMAIHLPDKGSIWRQLAVAVLLLRSTHAVGPQTSMGRNFIYQCNYSRQDYIRFNELEGEGVLILKEAFNYDKQFADNYTKLWDETPLKPIMDEFKSLLARKEFKSACREYSEEDRRGFYFRWFDAHRRHYFLLRDMRADLVQQMIHQLEEIVLSAENDVLIYVVIFLVASSLTILLSGLNLLNIWRLTEELQVFAKRQRHTEQSLAKTKLQGETLLHKILPFHVAEQLVKGNVVVPKTYKSATICYVDLHDFLSIQIKLSPLQVAELLGQITKIIDEISFTQKSVQKLDILSNDTFVMISGVPEEVQDHTKQMANFALMLMAEIMQFRTRGVQLKIGIHTGSVAAGVIGNRVPRFSVFGESVKMADRMCRTCPVGQIQMSQAAINALGSGIAEFDITERGQMDIRGMGSLTAYTLNAKKSATTAHF